MQIVVNVREVTHDDEAAVEEVSRLSTEALRRVYRPIHVPAATAAEARLARLVAIVKGNVVGTVRYRMEANRLHLVGLFVHPDHRCEGVARELVKALTAIASRNGAARLSLFTIRETGNVHVFEHLGFDVIREAAASDLESVSGQPLTEVYMERHIAG